MSNRSVTVESRTDEVVKMCDEDPIEAAKRITNGKGVQYVLECSGASNAPDETNSLREDDEDVKPANRS